MKIENIKKCITWNTKEIKQKCRIKQKYKLTNNENDLLKLFKII